MVESNCYALVSDGEAVLVDAGAHPDDIDAALQKHGLKLRAILLTHGHFDHILGAEAVAEKHRVPVYIHENDEEMLSDGMKNAYSVFFGGEWGEFHGAGTFNDGDVLSIFGEEIEVIHTPGHSEGSVCFKVGNNLFTGDTIFSRGTGRCDLYGGDDGKIRESIAKLDKLPADMTIYPGHGISCPLGESMKYARLI
jgi:glyoxylase-like metal-dependent hydrolase (beta-lactamase superfamily II)